jgi:hypothetical protein
VFSWPTKQSSSTTKPVRCCCKPRLRTTSTTSKDITNKSEALSNYARPANDPELVPNVSEGRLRAQRRLGELCAALPKVSGANLPNVSASRHLGKREVLRQAGLSKDVAHRCEKLAQVPVERFEAFAMMATSFP